MRLLVLLFCVMPVVVVAKDYRYGAGKHSFKFINDKEDEKDTTLVHKGVSFVRPQNGAKVSKKFKVEFSVVGMKIHPAGELVFGTGHHHLIIDGKPTKKGSVVPADKTHIHYGKGQTEAEITLSPGKHTLTLQFADGAHRSYGKAWSQTITVYVQ